MRLRIRLLASGDDCRSCCLAAAAVEVEVEVAVTELESFQSALESFQDLSGQRRLVLVTS